MAIMGWDGEEILSRKANGFGDGEMGDRLRNSVGGFTISLHDRLRGEIASTRINSVIIRLTEDYD